MHAIAAGDHLYCGFGKLLETVGRKAMGTKALRRYVSPAANFSKLPETAGRKAMGTNAPGVLCQPGC